MSCTIQKKEEIKWKLMNGELPIMRGQYPEKYLCCDYERRDKFTWGGSGMHKVLIGEKIWDGSIYVTENVLADTIKGPVVFCPDYKEHLADIDGARIQTEEIPRRVNNLEKEKAIKLFSDYDHNFIRTKTPKIDEIIRLIQYFPANPEKNMLVLAGKKGTGKTHLAQSLEYQEVSKGNTVEYIEWLSLEQKFWQHENLNYMLDCDLLIVDDFGEETPKEYTLEQFKNILDIFRTRKRPKKIMITTNKNEYDLRHKYGDKITGRIFENSILIWLEGKDYRFKGGAK